MENKGFLYGLTVILKNIGHFGNHSTYSVITVILVQKTVILPQWFCSRIYWIKRSLWYVQNDHCSNFEKKRLFWYLTTVSLEAASDFITLYGIVYTEHEHEREQNTNAYFSWKYWTRTNTNTPFLKNVEHERTRTWGFREISNTNEREHVLCWNYWTPRTRTITNTRVFLCLVKSFKSYVFDSIHLW